MAEFRAAGKCFNCGELGHMSWNCPGRNSMSGGNNNKPPGVPSYSMEMSLVEDMDNSDEMLDSVPVGYVGMSMDHVPLHFEPESWRKHYPIWQHPALTARERVTNCHVMMMEYQLTVMQPYPGDDNSVIYPCHPG